MEKAVLLGALVLEMERDECVVAERGSQHGEALTLRRDPGTSPLHARPRTQRHRRWIAVGMDLGAALQRCI